MSTKYAQQLKYSATFVIFLRLGRSRGGHGEIRKVGPIMRSEAKHGEKFMEQDLPMINHDRNFSCESRNTQGS